MDTVEASKAPKLAKYSLLCAVVVLLLAMIETNVSPFKHLFVTSAQFKLMCGVSWLVGTIAGLVCGICALAQRRSGETGVVLPSMIGIVLSGLILGLFLIGMGVGLIQGVTQRGGSRAHAALAER